MKKKTYIDIEIDSLTSSIVNRQTRDVLKTEFHLVSAKEIKKKDWLFDWKKEFSKKNNEIYKMTIEGNSGIIQGLISLSIGKGFVFVDLVESAAFNRGKEKMYEGVGGNLFAFACFRSQEMGFEGFVSFVTKTALVDYYRSTLGAVLVGQRMIIYDTAANKLINHYFKNK
jgi:hypothetical protein